jgi:hypothetical protein
MDRQARGRLEALGLSVRCCYATGFDGSICCTLRQTFKAPLPDEKPPFAPTRKSSVARLFVNRRDGKFSAALLIRLQRPTFSGQADAGRIA